MGYLKIVAWHASMCWKTYVREVCLTESFMLSFQPFWRVWNAAGSDGRGVIGM